VPLVCTRLCLVSKNVHVIFTHSITSPVCSSLPNGSISFSKNLLFVLFQKYTLDKDELSSYSSVCNFSLISKIINVSLYPALPLTNFIVITSLHPTNTIPLKRFMVISSTQHVRKHLLIPVALTAGLYNSLYYTSFGFLSDLQGTTIPLSRFQIMATTSACILTRNSGRCVIVTVMFIRLGFRQGS